MSDDHTRITTVLKDCLYLTGAEGASDWPQVHEAKIQRVVNLSGLPDAFPDEVGMEYLTLEISDDADQDIAPVFEEACQFITAAENKATLVHCVQGCSRAASVVIAFLIKSMRWTLKQSYEHVLASRPIIEPNPGFWKHLERFECVTLNRTTPSLPLVCYLGNIARTQYIGEDDFDPELWKDTYVKCMNESFASSNTTRFPEMWDFLVCYEEMEEEQQSAKSELETCFHVRSESEGNEETIEDIASKEIEVALTSKRKRNCEEQHESHTVRN